MTHTFCLPNISLLRRARLHFAIIVWLLALTSHVSAQVVVFNSQDECVPSPEDGIFCGGDPGPGATVTILDYVISGLTAQTWTDGRHLYPQSLSIFIRYFLASESVLSLSIDPYSVFTGSFSGEGKLRLNSGTLLLSPSGSEPYQWLSPTPLVVGSTHSGGTEVVGGRLAIYDDAALGTGALKLAGTGTLHLLNSFSLRGFTVEGVSSLLSTANGATISGQVTGDGTLRVDNTSGTVTLAGNNTYSGGTEIIRGGLAVSTDANLGAANTGVAMAGATVLHLSNGFASSDRNLTLNGNAALSVADGTATWNGKIQGVGGFQKDGGGTLELTGNNTFTGGVAFAGGTLQVASANALGSTGALTFSGGTLQFTATNTTDYSARFSSLANQAFRFDTNGQNVTFASVIASTGGSLTKLGAGTLTLSASNTYSGGTTVEAGTLRAGAINAFGSGPLTVNGTLDLGGYAQTTGNLSGTGTVALGSVALTVTQSAATTFSGVLSGAGSFTKAGAGTLTLAGTNTFSGATLVTAGTLRTGAANTLSSTSALFLIKGATLDLAGHDQTVGDLDSYDATTANYYSPGTVNLGGATLTNLNRVINNWGGALTGTGTFLKKGTAPMNWGGANTFTGTLQIDAGTVSAQAANVLSPNATVSLAAGTTVLLNNHAQTIGGLAGAGTVTLGSGTLTVNSSDGTTYSGALTGTGALVKTGSGALILSGNNTFSGGVTLAGGTLQTGSANALGSTGSLLFTGGTLQFSLANDTDYSGRFSTAATQAFRVDTNGRDITFASALTSAGGSLTKLGQGTLTLTGGNAYSGATTVASGTLRVNAGGTLGSGALTVDGTLDLGGTAYSTGALSGAGTIALGSAALTVTQTGDSAFSGTLTGAGALTKSGTGTLMLSGNNTFSAGLTLAAGTLQAASTGALGASGPITMGGGTLQFSAANTTDYSPRFSAAAGQSYRVDTNGQEVTFASALASAGATLTKLGAGTLALHGDNAFTGGAVLGGGALELGSTAALGSTGAITFSGGTLRFSAANAADYSGRFSNASGQSYRLDTNGQDLTLASALTSSGGSLTKLGTGSLTLAGPNTYTGGTTVESGTLRVGAANALPTGSVTVNGTLDLNGYAQTFSALSGTGTLAAGSAAITLNPTATATWGGTITGSGVVTKMGAGTQVLTGANNYSGATVLKAGTLRTGATNALSSSSAHVLLSGSTLDLAGYNQTVGDLDSTNSSTGLLETSTIALGGATLTNLNRVTNNWAGTLTGNGTVVKQGTADMQWSGTNTFTGTLQVDAGVARARATNVFSPNAVVQIASGAALDFNHYTQTLGGLGGAGTVTLGTGAIALNQSPNTTFSGSLVGSGSLTKSGAGSLALTGDNSTFSGNVILSGGTLQAGSTQALGSSGTVTFAGGTLQFSAAQSSDLSSRFSTAPAQAYRFDTNGQDVTLATALTSSGGYLAKLGAGTLTLTGANTYTGGTTVAGGTLRTGAAYILNPDSTLALVGGATLQLAGNNQTVANLDSYNPLTGHWEASTLDLGGATLINRNQVTNNWAGSLIGDGTVIKKGSAVSMYWSGTNTFTGSLQIETGTVLAQAANVLSPNAVIAFTGYKPNLFLQGYSQTIGGLSGDGFVYINRATATLTIAQAVDSTFSGRLGGAGAVVKTGPGELTLTAANDFDAGLTLAGGSVRVVSNSSLGVDYGSLTFAGGTLHLTTDMASSRRILLPGAGTIRTDADANVVWSGAISGTGSFTKSGAGSLTLTGANTATGGTTLAEGTLAVSANPLLGDASSRVNFTGGTLRATDSFASTRATTVATGGGTFQVDATKTLTWDGVIDGTGALTKSGAGTLALTGENTFSGGLTLAAGTIAVAHDAALGVSGVAATFDGGTLATTASFTSDRAVSLDAGGGTFDPAAATTLTWNGNLSGAGTLTKAGTGTLVLAGNNTYAGTTYVNAGTLQLGSATALSPLTTLQVASGATFDAHGFAQTFANLAGTGAIDTGSSGLTVTPTDTNVFAGTLTGSGNLTVNGTGTLVLNNTNTYSGTTQIDAGTLRLGVNDALPTGTHVTLGRGATLDLDGHATTVNRIAGGHDTTVAFGANGTLTLAATTDSTFGGAISGQGALVKTGTGQLTLTGSGNFSGGTQVNAGTLVVNGTFATNTVAVNSGATLGGGGTIGGLTLASGSTLAVGNSPGTLTVEGNTTWSGGANYVWEINDAANPATSAGTNYDLLSISGTLTINATAGNKFTLTLASLLENNSAGDVVNFNSGVDSSYTIASATGGIIGFDANAFTINASGFTNTLNGGSWSLALGNNNHDLNLNFTAAAIPEPSTYAAIFGALALSLTLYRKRPRRL